MKKCFILLLCVILVSSIWFGCDKKNKGNNGTEVDTKNSTGQATTSVDSKITEEIFIDYYVKTSMILERFSDNPDSLAAHLESLRKGYGITKKDVDEFRKSNYDNAEKWKEVWAKIEEKIKKERVRL